MPILTRFHFESISERFLVARMPLRSEVTLWLSYYRILD